MIDFVINLRTGGPHLKSLVNTVINERSIVCPSDQPGYRNFFLGSPSGTVDVRAIAGRLSEALLGPRPMPTLRVWLPTRSSARYDGSKPRTSRTKALELQIAAHDAAMRRIERVNDQLLRVRVSSDEQAVTARLQAAAARRASEQAEQALADALSADRSAAEQQPAPPPVSPPLTLRRVAGKARRSPRWAARQVRARYSTSQPEPVVPVPVPDGDPPTRFDRHWYVAENPDVGDAGIDPWVHYRHHGRFEGRSPHALFDRAWYEADLPRCCGRRRRPVRGLGQPTGAASRNPNEFFDVGWYLSRHPEVGEAGLDPVEHYRLHGWREGRRPGPLFDPTWYLATYPDVAAADIDPLTHYLNFGRAEGRHANHLEHVSCDPAATGRRTG